MKEIEITLFISNEQRFEMAKAEKKITGINQYNCLGRKRDSGEFNSFDVVAGGYVLYFGSVEQKTMFIMRHL